MNERRSGRSRKQIDYTKFDVDIDNDDDFADPTPPPPKKQKKPEKTERKKEKEKVSKNVTSDLTAGRKGRTSLDEKLYERDLQTALEMSLQSSEEAEEGGSSKNTKNVNCDAILHSTPKVPSHHGVSQTDLMSESQTIMPSAIPGNAVTVSEDIEFLGTVTCSDVDSPVSKPRTASKQKAYVCDDEDESSDEDEDFSDDVSDSDSDFNDADSDFDDSKVKGKSKAKGKVKPPATKSKPTLTKGKTSSAAKDSKVTTQKTSVAARLTQKRVGGRETTTVGVVKNTTAATTTTTSPLSNSNKVNTAVRKPAAWTPPGRSGDSSSSASNSLKSPSSGLRLGLSRHARIKPLHPSLKVS